MFSVFKKKRIIFHSPVKGKLISLSEVDDPVFSEGMMGPGFAVQPEADELYSPVAGEITSIFPTNHAIALKCEDGKEILIHIGIDTVELKGAGFEILVKEGEKVTSKTQLACVNRAFLKEQNKANTIMVLFPNETETFSFRSKFVEASEEIELK